ncbi:FAD-dependent oxidoreductase, partial [Streptomyces sp. SID5785]
IGLAVRVGGQRYLDPAGYVSALGEQVRIRGAKISENVTATAVERVRGRSLVRCADGTRREADAVVIANGAWMPGLAAAHGVRVPQHPGRGYSFSVPLSEPLRGPLYFAAPRVAVAPRGDHAHVAGVMELRSPDHPLDRSRIDAITRAIRPLINGADWNGVSREWVGSRPLTGDGVPVVGPTRTEGVYVAGGHGMWGLTLGPLTGRLLADRLVTGSTPPELAWMNPVR